MNYKEIEGNLITLANQGMFNVIGHGCNCLSTMGAGLAPQMAKAYGCDKFRMELMGPNINKLGNIDYQKIIVFDNHELIVCNIYSQYSYGRNHKDGTSKPIDYDALTIALRKMNVIFKGMHIGLPEIGCGLAGGDWNVVKHIIETELVDCDVTIVKYDGK